MLYCPASLIFVLYHLWLFPCAVPWMQNTLILSMGATKPTNNSGRDGLLMGIVLGGLLLRAGIEASYWSIYSSPVSLLQTVSNRSLKEKLKE